jgi:hypothetical protein
MDGTRLHQSGFLHPLDEPVWTLNPLHCTPMAIPSDIRTDAEAALSAFCQAHSSSGNTDQLRYTYEFESSSALLVEQRPSFMNPDSWTSKPIAKFRFSEARSNWSLYWGDASRKWHRVSNAPAEKDLRKLLQVVLDDPLGVFWS